MKAWEFTAIEGSLDQSLSLNKAATSPSHDLVTGNQVLIEVISAAINPVEYKLPETKIMGSLMTHAKTTPGLDFCGRVIAKHPSNELVQEGQIVFGGLTIGSKFPKFGTLAQVTVASASECATLPEGISYDHAAAVGTSAMTALQSLPRDRVAKGSKVFINGGSGGVGTYTIQFAKALGAHVTTTCSTANMALCYGLGADNVIDYRTSDVLTELEKGGQIFDVAVDNVGSAKQLYDASHKFLKPTGVFMQVGMQTSLISMMTRGRLPAWLGGGQRAYQMVKLKNVRKDYEQIGWWMLEGKVRAVIDETFEFEDAPKAYAKLRLGRAKGKIVVHVGK